MAALVLAMLAFEQSGLGYSMNDRLGIIVESLISAVPGYAILRVFSRPASVNAPAAH